MAWLPPPTSAAAWRQAYALLSGVMIEAAWPARLAATEWQAQAG
jgi:hypothetical protein